jgi:hypothetical protein
MIKNVMIFLPIIIAFGFNFFLTFGRSLNPKTFAYNNLFNKKAKFYIIFGIVCSIIGLVKINYEANVFYLSPLISICLIYLFNFFIKKLYNRNIYLLTKWDFKPQNIKFLDYFFGILILIISLFFPLILKIYFDN